MHTTTLPRHARTGVLALGWRKARTGEDPDELYPIWPILGGAEDDDQDDEDKDDDQDDGDDTSKDGEDDDDQDDDEGATDLGDKGKQALDRMKAKLKTERERRKAAEGERDQLKSGGAGDKDADQIRAEADRAATNRANQRIVRSEVRAAAAGKLANPKDALAFLDLTQFEVDEDGQADEDDIAEAIDNLLKERPYLAAAGKPQRFQGTGDGGARKGSGGVKQLGKKDLEGMSAEQIEAARQKGQLRDYLNE
jgi:hypothetical protein